MIFQENKVSINGKIWQQKVSNEHYVLALSRAVGISDFLAKILLSRIDSIDHALDFISPKLKNLLPDPFHLLDMKKAVEKTIEAILNNQKICIFADYDVDGATSSALLKNIFRDLGKVVDIYVPDRISEGYGPSIYAMQKIKDNGTCLLITVDCGAMAHEALKYAKQVGIDVIVIDHHISSDNLPDAVAVVNPNRIDETSEYKYLAAVGVSFLFATALLSDLQKLGFFNIPLRKLPTAKGFEGYTKRTIAAYIDLCKDQSTGSTYKSLAAVEFPKPDLMQYLDLVALGTVCDVMNLIKLNRAFVSQGLKIMQQRRNLGMKILSDTAGLNEKPNCYHLGFILGPRINAGGRVGKSSLGANLLSTTCNREANELALELEKHNNERKVLELVIIDEAIEIAKSQENNNLLFIIGKNWHPGVIGIVAGKLKEKFNKPVAVIALNKGIGKASCRSVKNIDFGSKILNAKNKDLLVVGGGHAMAAGFTVLEEKLEELQKFLNEAFAEDLKNNFELNHEEYDLDLTTNSINMQLINELAKLEPFGQGNPEPLFKFEDLWVLKADIVGNKHIRCLLAPSRSSFGSKTINAIAFNAVATPIENILLNIKLYTLSVIGSLKVNSWHERHTIQLQIKDVII